MRTIPLFPACLALLAATACGASDDPSAQEHGGETNARTASPAPSLSPAERAAAAAVPTREPEVLEKLQVGSHELTFYRVMVPEAGGPEASIMLHEAGGLDSPDALMAITAANGPLTMLEVFKAYAPPNRVAHEALVASHAVEAKWLGRPDASVKTALFPKTMYGTSPGASCLNYVFPDVYPYHWTQKNSLMSSDLDSNAYLCAGDPVEAYTNVSPVSRKCKNKSKLWLTTAVCNDGFNSGCYGSVTATFGYGPSTDGEWSMKPLVTLPAATYQRLSWGPSGSNEKAKGLSAIGTPTSYTHSNPCTVFHVVSGVAIQ